MLKGRPLCMHLISQGGIKEKPPGCSRSVTRRSFIKWPRRESETTSMEEECRNSHSFSRVPRISQLFSSCSSCHESEMSITSQCGAESLLRATLSVFGIRGELKQALGIMNCLRALARVFMIQRSEADLPKRLTEPGKWLDGETLLSQVSNLYHWSLFNAI